MLVPSDGMHSTNNLEWYNAAAGLESVSDTCDLTIMLDNQALYKVYKNSILGVEEMNVSVFSQYFYRSHLMIWIAL